MTRVSPSVTVGLDIGTTSVKAIAADDAGNVVARARVPHDIRIPDADLFEHDAVVAWRDGPRRAFDEVRADLDVRAVAVAAMVPSFCAVDGEGVPITPGLLYGDRRGHDDGQDRSTGDGGEALEFLRWCASTAPDAAGYWPAPAVANHALGGVAAVDGATAFSSYPLYGLDGWDVGLVTGAGARVDQLPTMAGNGAAIGTVTGTDVVLAAGCIDAMGEQIVAAADEPGDVLVICGTTLITWVNLPEQLDAPGLWTIPHTTPGAWLAGGPSNAGGLFLNWATRLLGDGGDGGDVHPDRVPVWLPYVRGERVPVHDASRRAVLDGLDLTHGPGALRRAAYEASGFACRHAIDLTGVPARRIVATGGGTHSAEWMQALADCTGLPVDVVAVPEGAALGTAFVARMALGLEQGMHEARRWARTARTVAPDPSWTDSCAARYDRYRRLAVPPVPAS
jgi:xylulokinase